MTARHAVRNVVLVHGGFVDGSGWQGVHERFVSAGYNVNLVQKPTESLVGDVAATLQVVAEQDGLFAQVGHSYGGVVISEAGQDPKVGALVHNAAFAPDRGESVTALIADPPPSALVPPILPPKENYLFLDRAVPGLPRR
ncbi:esterase/lipase family protein [Streptomyces sp. NBC_01717]|uniref:esterase/lipase family protein n=1 Tax=Streptomyces sp. NBC_01717 TaxID=2975918 RepID=UPI002E375286|nr:alpha/beta fold hydrolase [Streptomyces sp. NBC_01717]